MKAIIAGPITAIMVYRAIKKKSLTPLATVAAILTAIAHAYHPWNMPLVLLMVFFFTGTRVTHINEHYKNSLTLSNRGGATMEGPRNHIQVFANSIVASVLCILHARQIQHRGGDESCLGWPADLLAVGIVANYVSVAADTFSSELGILSRATPRLITSLTLRKVPPGTNGGITLLGVGAGSLGALILAVASIASAPKCVSWNAKYALQWVLVMTACGTLGSLLDSFLGGWLQASVQDLYSGKIVQADGGQRVLLTSDSQFHPGTDTKAALLHGEGQSSVQATPGQATGRSGPGAQKKHGRVILTGRDWLDNNGVNFFMALIMSLGAMGAASWMWNVPVSSIWA